MNSHFSDMDKILWLPKVIGFDKLFLEPKNDTESTKRGFPDTACILLSGTPGTGKTVVALSLLRDLMNQTSNSQAYFIGVEISPEKLIKNFTEFGWFGPEDQIFNERLRMPKLPELGWTHYPSDPGGLPHLVLETVRRDAELHLAKNPSGRLFVIVDSITSILKDCRNRGDRRRQAHRFLIRLLESVFPHTPSLILLISESSAVPEELEVDVLPEEYISDFVFKLALKHMGSGSRLRTFDVVKCHGANMSLGEHTFAIVTSRHVQNVIADPSLGQSLGVYGKKVCPHTDKWGTIVIAPRPRLRPIGETTKYISKLHFEEILEGQTIATGTPGLDAMLDGSFDSLPEQQRNMRKALYKAGTTLALGSTGTGKTIMSIQFILAHENPSETLYVNFEDTRENIFSLFPANGPITRGKLANCNFLYRRRSNLDINLLFLEICHVIENKKIRRVAIDGLSELLAPLNKQNYSIIVETLTQSIHKASNNKAAIFVTYEVPPNFTAFAPPTEGLSVAADNIIALRHVPISDEVRKTIYVLKARAHKPDTGVREVIINFSADDSEPLRVRSGLESFTNLLSGEVKPLTVTLNLFAENQAEQRFNEKLRKSISGRFGY